MLRSALLGMTAIAVISDTMLLPYYPQLFEARFAISSALIVGLYLASISLAVMLAFPIWVVIAKKRDTLSVLVSTQLAAGGLSIGCYAVDDVGSFWMLSIVMVCFKASYLLMYPYVIAMQPLEKHATTIGALAVIVHFGGIIGAVSGSEIVEIYGYSLPYVLMALGDFLQAAICVFLLKSSMRADSRLPSTDIAENAVPLTMEEKRHFAVLACIMLLFYFGFYMSMPFMTLWWQTATKEQLQHWAGFVYAIPGFAAISILAWDYKKGKSARVWRRNEVGLCLTAFGLAVQSLPHPVCIVIGRIVFGIGLYYVTIGLDALFFERARKSRYASGFSLLNIARNSGVMLAATASGLLVQQAGEGLPFLMGGLTVLATAFLYRISLKPGLRAPNSQAQPL